MQSLSSFPQLMALESTAVDQFRAPAGPERNARTYGGQLLAQGLHACQLTVADDRRPHSLHSYFLRAGVSDEPVEIAVERVRDGRGFSSRACSVVQGGRELFRLQASFQVPEVGLDYVEAVAPPAPAPETLNLTYTEFQFDGSGPLESVVPGAVRPMDVRYVNPPSSDRQPVTESQLHWMRIPEVLDDGQSLHMAGLAYLADSTLIDHVVLPHGRRWQDADLESASLDHAMWFHRNARVDEWLLYEQFVEVTGGARGLARGRIFDRAGHLVATCMQEGLIRVSD